MSPDRAFKIIDIVIRAPTSRLGQRALYKSYLYPHILWRIDERYKTASARRMYMDMAKLMAQLEHHDIPYLIHRCFLKQYWITKPYRACITTIGDKYENWHLRPVSELYNDVHNAFKPIGYPA